MIDFNSRLIDILGRHDRLAIAVSGGVDSMTLAFIAHRFARGRVEMVHAVSPSVPALATARVKDYALREAWRLTLVDSGEFDDEAYRSNPHDRCYFCKSCLYDRIAEIAGGAAVASGANLDDLDDYRPGLRAAEEHHVIHPFIEAGVDKEAVRALARHYDLRDISDLPAQPCLSSRVETGIGIDPGDLAFIDLMERNLGRIAEPRDGVPASAATLRCRITSEGVFIEVGAISRQSAQMVAAEAAGLCALNNRLFLGVRPYRRGSAFLVPAEAELLLPSRLSA